MRKYLIAASVAATLLASQAAASQYNVDVDAGDRGASAAGTSNYDRDNDKLLFWLGGGILIGLVAYYASQSENPSSP